MKTGWQIKKLGDVCSLLNRGISPAYLEEGGVCVLNQKCVRDHEVSYEPPSASKDDVFLFKSPGGLMEQLNDCLQHGCSS